MCHKGILKHREYRHEMALPSLQFNPVDDRPDRGSPGRAGCPLPFNYTTENGTFPTYLYLPPANLATRVSF